MVYPKGYTGKQWNCLAQLFEHVLPLFSNTAKKYMKSLYAFRFGFDFDFDFVCVRVLIKFFQYFFELFFYVFYYYAEKAYYYKYLIIIF